MFLFITTTFSHERIYQTEWTEQQRLIVLMNRKMYKNEPIKTSSNPGRAFLRFILR